MTVTPDAQRLARLTNDHSSDGLRRLLLPFLVELYERTGDMGTLGILDGPAVVILSCIRSHRHRRLPPTPDRIMAHHCADLLVEPRNPPIVSSAVFVTASIHCQRWRPRFGPSAGSERAVRGG